MKNRKENLPGNFGQKSMGKIGRKISRAVLVKKAWEKIGRKISRAVLVKKGMGKNRKENIPGNFGQKSMFFKYV